MVGYHEEISQERTTVKIQAKKGKATRVKCSNVKIFLCGLKHYITYGETLGPYTVKKSLIYWSKFSGKVGACKLEDFSMSYPTHSQENYYMFRSNMQPVELEGLQSQEYQTLENRHSELW